MINPITLRHLRPVLGLKKNDIEDFENIKIKANNLQLPAMIKDLEQEIKDRKRRGAE